jgi:hypothetical protein
MQKYLSPVGVTEESNESAIASIMSPQDRLDPGSATTQQSTNGGLNNAHESMAEPELLALIVELRLGAGRPSGKDKDKDKSSNGSKSSSTSAVDTLDLCHRKIEKLPYDMVDIIKDDVVR